MKAEHTPTPWTLAGGTNKKCQLFIWMAGTYAGGHAIATVHDIQEPAKANAEFIVRACNSHDRLLDACKQAHAFLCSDVPTPSGRISAGLALEAALALAEKGARL